MVKAAMSDRKTVQQMTDHRTRGNSTEHSLCRPTGSSRRGTRNDQQLHQQSPTSLGL